MVDVFDISDFEKIGKDLAENKKYLEIAASLKKEGKHFTIMDRESSEPYLERHYYLNLRPFARLVIHQFLRSDIDGLHDHPWPFETYILSGGYWEQTEHGRFWRPPGYHGRAESTFFHRVELDPERAKDEVWTLFMMGPREKEWGFLNEEGLWEQWQSYLDRKGTKE